jgi:hypothetical protein
MIPPNRGHFQLKYVRQNKTTDKIRFRIPLGTPPNISKIPLKNQKMAVKPRIMAAAILKLFVRFILQSSFLFCGLLSYYKADF